MERGSSSYVGAPLMLTAGLLSAYGLIRRKPALIASAALGAAGLVVLSRNFERTDILQGRQYEAVASFAINCTAQRAYRMWREFENLPRFMQHLDSVVLTTNGQTRWTAAGPMGSKVSWNAEIVDDMENERISWRSLPESQLTNSGSIEFKPGAHDRGIVAMLRIRYVPPGGALGKAFLTFLGKNPEFTAREDLRRFKALLEAGELPTTKGQPHGPRGVHGHLQHMLLRESTNIAPPEASETMRRSA